MKLVLYALFVAVFFLDYFAVDLEIISRKATLAQELLSVIALLLVLMRATLNRKINLHVKYVGLFLALVALIAVSAIVNHVSSGTLIAGMRLYFKYLPFFLVPAVFDFTEGEIRAQLKFLLALSLLQLPIAVYQRLIEFQRGILSGDAVAGTLTISSILSIYLICCIAIVMAFYLHRRISKPVFFSLLALLFFPTTINETKGTLILMPLAIIVPVLLMPGNKSLARRLGPVVLVGVLMGGIFISMYNSFLVESEYASHGSKLTDFFSDQGKLEHYLYGGAATAGDVTSLDDDPGSIALPFEGTEERVSRIDSMILPFRLLSDDPIKLIVGLGIGNVSVSFIDEFSGRYAVYTDYYGANITVVSLMLWELGLAGVILAVVMLIVLFSDARAVCARNDFAGVFALGWTAIVIIMLVAMPYKNVIHFGVIGYLFWYFSGYVAAQRIRGVSTNDAVPGSEKQIKIKS